MKIFILEDDPQRMQLFRGAGFGHDITHAEDVSEATRKWDPPYDLVCLDHDLGGEVYVDAAQENTGSGFCRWLVKVEAPPQLTIIHSYNPIGALEMMRILRNGGWEPIRNPFGPSLIAIFQRSVV